MAVLMMLWGFRKIGVLIMAGLSLILLPANCSASHDARKARKDAAEAFQARDKALGDLAKAQGSVAKLEASVAKQNAAVDALEADGRERTQRANAAIKAVQAKADIYRRRDVSVASARPGADLCKSARDLLGGILQEERR